MAISQQVKFHAVLANIAGVPQTIMLPCTAQPMLPRFFCGAGAPSSTTLQAGPQVANSMYVSNAVGQLPDFYVDITNFNIYVCTASGTNATATWKQISGSGGSLNLNFQIYASGGNYSPGTIVRVTTTTEVNGIALTPGHYFCVQPVIAPPSPNMVPQYPEPTSGIIYWYWLGFLGTLANICENGEQQIWIQSTSPFSTSPF